MNRTSRPAGGPSRALPTVPAAATEDILGAETRARALFVWCALSDVGLDETARLSRTVARDVLELVEALVAERSAREAFQERTRRQEAIILRRGGRAGSW
jgi:hypothetical protein